MPLRLSFAKHTGADVTSQMLKPRCVRCSQICPGANRKREGDSPEEKKEEKKKKKKKEEEEEEVSVFIHLFLLDFIIFFSFLYRFIKDIIEMEASKTK